MRLLVLGGTAWLGNCIATTAVGRGHDVTCLARGSSGAVPDGVTFLRADRDQPGAYDDVRSRQWDAVVDVARQPGHVRRAVDALADRSRSFVFISSGNVYADHSTPGQDERAALLPALDSDVMASMDTYGEAKVACEQHVLNAFGADGSVIVRAGLIGGPGDPYDRSGYWPLRFARPALPDGRVLVPDVPDLLTQLIDVRDLGSWIVDVAADGGMRGAFNAVGNSIPLSQHLEVARSVAGHTGRVVVAEPDWLVDQGVAPWMGQRSLPLWLPPDYAGFGARDGSAGRAAGLVPRPLEETLTDTLAWELATGPRRPRQAGLTDDDERELLLALTAS